MPENKGCSGGYQRSSDAPFSTPTPPLVPIAPSITAVMSLPPNQFITAKPRKIPSHANPIQPTQQPRERQRERKREREREREKTKSKSSHDLLPTRRTLQRRNIRVLDSKAPDIKVIADRDDNVHHKGPVHPRREPQHREQERNLVDPAAQDARPAEAGVREEVRAQAVDDAGEEREGEDVEVGEGEEGQVGGDDLADGVGVGYPGEERKGHDVGGEDRGLEVEVRDDEGPDGEEGREAGDGGPGLLAPGAPRADDVADRLEGVEDEDDAALDHVPLCEGQAAEELGDGDRGGEAEGREHGLGPEGGAAEEAGEGVDCDEDEDAFHGPVDDAKGQGLCVVLVPGLDVEGQEGWRVLVVVRRGEGTG